MCNHSLVFDACFSLLILSICIHDVMVYTLSEYALVTMSQLWQDAQPMMLTHVSGNHHLIVYLLSSCTPAYINLGAIL